MPNSIDLIADQRTGETAHTGGESLNCTVNSVLVERIARIHQCKQQKKTNAKIGNRPGP